MEDYVYDPNKLITEDDFKVININPFKPKENTVFNMGPVYEDEPNKTIVCKVCGSDKFYVGRGHCHTAVKCPICEYEIMIHEG